MAIVSLTNLGKSFPGQETPALADISAELKPGIITGLVGPDGAGKTTLIRILAGLMRPSSGTVEVETPREMIGYMPQKFGLYEDLSVQENLNLYADLRGVLGDERRDSFSRLLEFTDLKRFTARLAGKLSGGMKQKLGLGCALLGNPKLLLLDEPSVGVDPISRRELWKMVQDLIKTGIAVVWSTAYLDEAELCQEVLLLNKGKLLFAGEPAELTARVQGRALQVRSFPGSRRQLLTRALRLKSVIDGVIQGRNVRLLLARDAKPPTPRELGANNGAEIVEVKPRFEDAFIDILGGGPGGDSALAKHLEKVPSTIGAVIEAENLTKKFGDFVATDSVSFKVAQGEIFGLLGPNGAGKSTTFKMMCGLLKPTSGSAHVMGIDLKTSAARARQELGYMAQKFSLYGDLAVQQNLAFFSGVYGLSGSRQERVISDMVRIFALQPYLGASAETLPLGFKQRLALACAAMHEPAILFLDEPTSGVDPVTRREFWTHINGVVEKGVTVMVTTHFMDEAEYCDRIGLVFRGKMIAIGTPDELKQSVATKAQPDPTMEDAFIEIIQRSTR